MYEPANAAQLDGKIQVNKFRTALGLAWFDCAALEQDASGMGASCDITENPAHLSPLPTFPTKHKATLIKAAYKSCSNQKILDILLLKLLKVE